MAKNIFGYARVSSTEQNLDMQIDEIKKAYPGCIVLDEKISGTSLKGRDNLDLILNKLAKKGDKIVIWSIDRLGRSVRDLTNIVHDLEKKGVDLEILDRKVDTSTPHGKFFFNMSIMFAEYENSLRKQRQDAGIKAAKKRGKRFGRLPILSEDQKNELILKYKSGVRVSNLAIQFKVSRTVIYNALKELKVSLDTVYPIS
jgi:DNA invertase Pin-like site-specific DNA recombinase